MNQNPEINKKMEILLLEFWGEFAESSRADQKLLIEAFEKEILKITNEKVFRLLFNLLCGMKEIVGGAE